MREFVLAVLIKATLVLGGAGGLALVWRRSAAARRHLLWALALGAVVLLPLAQWLGPIWPVLPPVATVRVENKPSAQTFAPRPLAAPVDEIRSPARREASTQPEGTAPVSPVPTSGGGLASWLLALWLGGVLMVLGGFAFGRWRVARLAARSQEVTAATWRELFDTLRAELGLRGRVKLLTVSGPAMPMTWGVRHPVVLLPAGAASWPEQRRRDVLLHELAHVERRDCLTQLLAVVACALYWFHPLVWVAAGRMRVERERACDDRVLAAGTRPSEYAEHLLEIARTLRAGAATALASLAMARPSHLANRLLDVLEPTRRRDALTRRLVWSGAVGAVLVVLPLAAARPSVPAPVSAVTSVTLAVDPPQRGGGSVASIVVTPSQPVTGRRDSADCQFRPPKVVNWSSVQQHDHDLVVRSTIGRCITELRASTEFKFTADFTDIASVEGGGLVVIEQRGGEVDHRVEIRGGSAAEHRWFVANDERPYDEAARAWLAATLTDLLRRTGYAAEARSRWILSTRGVEAEFQEIAQLGSDYAKRIYYQALVADGSLAAATVARVVHQAGEEISSDYDLAELLVAVAAKYPLTEPTRTAFVTAANHLESDYDRHRVLAVVLAGRDLPDDLAGAILGSAGGIQSDYDLAEVLIVLIQKHPIGEGMSAAFFTAVNSIESDYDRHRVLATLLAQRREPPPALVAAALKSASAISSDYDRAEVLVQVAEGYALDDATRAPFFAAIEGIGSDYDHGRVLKAVMERPGVAGPVVAGVIASARQISSDYDRAEVLVMVAEHARFTDELRRAFLEAARGIGSDYDRTRVLAALGNAQL